MNDLPTRRRAGRFAPRSSARLKLNLMKKTYRPRLTEREIKLILSGMWYHSCSTNEFSRMEYDLMRRKLYKLLSKQ